jgi:AAA+ ATPase superfamily predicted ATPase
MRQVGFVGRQRELARLDEHLAAVKNDGQGRLLSIRGRRQSGKSRLLTEFADRTRLPVLFFTGSRLTPPREELLNFADEAQRSSLPERHVFEDVVPDSWAGAFRLLAAALPDEPSIVVLDEFPWLVDADSAIEGQLQTAWDRLLEPKPVLLALVGSDISMMEALTTYERPLFGRAKQMVVEPFNAADTAAMIGVDDPAVVLDAQLVTGGYPRLCLEWRGAGSMAQFLRRQLSDETSDLLVVGRDILSAEFPADLQARQVLTAIGSGLRTNKEIATRAGIPGGSLARSLTLLNQTKRVIAVDEPLSTKPTHDPRYSVSDSYLRFWLRFVQPLLPDISRGHADTVYERVMESWPDYRGHAIEPLVRGSLERLAADHPTLRGVHAVGGYWTRRGDVEVDIVGADRWPEARRILVVGSIKWRERAPFDRKDLLALASQRARVPGAEDAALVVVSRSGVSVQDVDASFTPEDLLAAWR